MKKYDYIVLGAGVAGLSFCKRISETSSSMLLLEKENTVGGVARSIYHEGFIMDFCAHRFHSGNQKLLDEVLSLDGQRIAPIPCNGILGAEGSNLVAL